MKAWIAVLVLVSSSAFAQEMTCLDKLLPFNRHSGVHQITKEQCSVCSDTLDSAGARKALNSLIISRLFCRENEVQLTMEPMCDVVSADIPDSNVCYVKTNLGHFFITKDRARNFNIIFSKSARRR
jgi:hypothetical protein